MYKRNRNRTAAQASRVAAAFITAGGINCGNTLAVQCTAVAVGRSATQGLLRLTLVQQMLAMQYAAGAVGACQGVSLHAVPRAARPPACPRAAGQRCHALTQPQPGVTMFNAAQRREYRVYRHAGRTASVALAAVRNAVPSRNMPDYAQACYKDATLDNALTLWTGRQSRQREWRDSTTPRANWYAAYKLARVQAKE